MHVATQQGFQEAGFVRSLVGKSHEWNLKKSTGLPWKSWKTRKMPKVMENENVVSNNLMII